MNEAVHGLRADILSLRDDIARQTTRQSDDLKQASRSDLKEAMTMIAQTNKQANKEMWGKILRWGFGGIAVIGIMTGGTGAIGIFQFISHLIGW